MRSLVLDGAYAVTGGNPWYPSTGPTMRRSVRDGLRALAGVRTFARLAGSLASNPAPRDVARGPQCPEDHARVMSRS